jgi:hypothetical protein
MKSTFHNLLDRKHDQAIGQYLDEWQDQADDPQAALVSIAASLRQLVAELNQLRQVIVNKG